MASPRFVPPPVSLLSIWMYCRNSVKPVLNVSTLAAFQPVIRYGADLQPFSPEPLPLSRARLLLEYGRRTLYLRQRHRVERHRIAPRIDQQHVKRLDLTVLVRRRHDQECPPKLRRLVLLDTVGHLAEQRHDLGDFRHRRTARQTARPRCQRTKCQASSAIVRLIRS